MIVPIVRIRIAVFLNTSRKMVIDIFHPGEARAANYAHEFALRSVGCLRLFHAFSIDSAVSGLADLPHSRSVGVTAFTTWHLYSKSVFLKRKGSSS